MQNCYAGIDVKATCRRLACFIKMCGVSDRQLSVMLNTSVQSVNKWRHAHNLPDIENMFVICRMLGITLDDLIVPADSKADMGTYGKGRRIRIYTLFLRILSGCKKSQDMSLSGGPVQKKTCEYSSDGIELCFGA